MILKMATRDHASVIGKPGWQYLDRISRVETHGYVTPVDAEDRRISCTFPELKAWVENCWGTERGFAHELWPEWLERDTNITVEAVKLTRDDGTMVLALLAHDAFLLSDDGKTIDRLR